MTDINKELQKLKALINQKQTTAIFSNKSNESTKLALGDAELYINDMTRKFSFTRAGVKNPVMIDAKTKSLENVEYLNGTKVEDLTSSVAAIEALEHDIEELRHHKHEVMDYDVTITKSLTVGGSKDLTFNFLDTNRWVYNWRFQGGLNIMIEPNVYEITTEHVFYFSLEFDYDGVIRTVSGSYDFTQHESMPSGTIRLTYESNFDVGAVFMTCTSSYWIGIEFQFPDEDYGRKFPLTMHELRVAGKIEPVPPTIINQNGNVSIPRKLYVNDVEVRPDEYVSKDVVEELDERLTVKIQELENKSFDINSITTGDVIVEPFEEGELTWTMSYTDTELRIVFNPEISADNLMYIDGYSRFMSIKWDSDIYDEVYYMKVSTGDNTYTLDFVLHGTSIEEPLTHIDCEIKDSTLIYKHKHPGSVPNITDELFRYSFQKLIFTNISLRDGKFKSAVVNTIHDETKDIKEKVDEHDNRITALEEAETSIDVVEELIDDKVVYDPYNVTVNWSQRTDDDGFKYIDFTFDPAITEANLQPGTHYFADVTFDAGGPYSVGWTKSLDDNRQWKVTYINGRLNNNTWEYIYPTTRYVVKSVTTYNDKFCQNLVAKYELSDDRLTEAIMESTGLNAESALEGFEDRYIGYHNYSFLDTYKNWYDYKLSVVNTLVQNGTYQFVIQPPIRNDNLKVGSNIILAEAEIRKTSGSTTTSKTYQLKYTKTLKSDNTCTVTWHSGSMSVTGTETTFTLITGATGWTIYNISEYFEINTFIYQTGNYMLESSLKNAMVNLIYPIGSIYMSFSRKSPLKIFGVGTWELITDTFLYCNDTTKLSGETGGSKKITVANLPSHNHTFTGTKSTGTFATMHSVTAEGWYSGPFSRSSATNAGYNSGSDNDHYKITWNYTPAGTVNNTGSGSDYMPPYITVYAWRRTA